LIGAILSKRVLITGAAGFIGANLLSTLKGAGFTVRGIDNYSDYYSPQMKKAHVLSLNLFDDISLLDINSYESLYDFFRDFKPTQVIHLAAQGGVRASKKYPMPYLTTNQMGFQNIIQLCEEFKVHYLFYASSSSVYGQGLKPPFAESDHLPSPKSLYALSKISNELVASYFPFESTKRIGMRFFSVYGPWGRPDMAIYRLVASSFLKTDFQLTASGNLARDFTYVQDISDTIKSLLDYNNYINKNEIINIASNNPETMENLFRIIQDLGCKLSIIQNPKDELDVDITHGSVKKLENWNIKVPQTSLIVGIQNTIDWMRSISTSELNSWLNSIKQ